MNPKARQTERLLSQLVVGKRRENIFEFAAYLYIGLSWFGLVSFK